MIQRIQSVWLALAATCAFLTFKLPFYSGTSAKGATSYELNASETVVLALITIVTGVLAAFTIFLFKHRPAQLRLCVLGIVLEAVLLFLYYKELKTFTGGTYSLWSLLHSIIIILFFLAARSINKDEKLIKDSDRLR
jgi:Ca2+/Na+ antiporter